MRFIRSRLTERFCDRRAQVLLLLVFFFYIFTQRTDHITNWRGFNGRVLRVGENNNSWIIGDSEEWADDERNSGMWSSNQSDQACPIPVLEPFSKVVVDYLATVNKTFDSCDKEYPLLFNSTLEGEMVPTKSLEEYGKLGVQSCCYRVILRTEKKDSAFRTKPECHPLSLENTTKIPPDHEFITIKCTNDDKSTQNTTERPFTLRKGQTKVMDMHAFIHVKPEVEERQNKIEREGPRKGPNVVIYGLDAVSRMNFLRTMPKTYDYLTKKLKAVDMTGYNKVADNTFPNMLPMMTSLSASEIGKNCGKRKYYDDCPFIWKEFAKQGYRTSYAEDAPQISIFNFERKGFIDPPTDYYMRPFSMATKTICTQYMISASLCIGPRLGFQLLLDNMKKFVFQMSRLQKPFFQFTWSTSLTHDYLQGCALGDVPLLNSFEWLDQSGYLNDTVFILMSDHGSRVDAFRNSLQGQLEDRLPFVFLILPEWMRTGEYSKAYQNLVDNANKLVTTFDLHQTLVDLLDMGKFENDAVQERTLALFQQTEKDSKLPQGISLFLPIPRGRTCDMAGIEPNYCSCNYLKLVPTDNGQVVKAASIAVKEINSMLKKYDNCAKLSLNLVKMAQHAGKTSEIFEGYLVNFETLPGKAMFEALVSRTKKNKWGDWGVTGTISRTNLYGNQSHCVHDSVIKLYCYCLESP